jgi:hypothetical protein
LQSWISNEECNCMEQSRYWEAGVIAASQNLRFIELAPGVLNS